MAEASDTAWVSARSTEDPWTKRNRCSARLGVLSDSEAMDSIWTSVRDTTKFQTDTLSRYMINPQIYNQ